MLKRYLPILIAFSLLPLLIPGCNTILSDFLSPENPSGLTPQIKTATAVPETPLPPEAITTQIANQNHLILWVPPQFDPAVGEAGLLFKEHVDVFVENHPGVIVEIRVKSLQGPAGLLSSLEKTLKAAPLAAPALLLLPQIEFQIASTLNLIHPHDELTNRLSAEDWYDYARNLAQVQNQVFGLPFAGDAPVLLYRPSILSKPPLNWEDILAYEMPMLFPAADDKAVFTMNLYLSAGGRIYDDQRQLTLDPLALEEVLEFYAEGAAAGTFPGWLLQYENDAEVWSAFQQKTTDFSISWISNYLSPLPVDVAAKPVPSLKSDSVTLATGWLWGFSDPYPERYELSLSLLDHLTDAGFLANWTVSAGYLPVRPSSMTAWQDQVINSLLSQITISAQSQPPNDVMNILGPALNEAVNNVLVNRYLPSEAARIAVDRVNEN